MRTKCKALVEVLEHALESTDAEGAKQFQDYIAVLNNYIINDKDGRNAYKILVKCNVL